MAGSLSDVAVPKRRQLAATLGLFATLFVAVGAVAATGPGTAVVHAFVVVALVVAAVLGLMGWGVLHSIRADRSAATEGELDAMIERAVAAQGGRMCDCGHEHDPTELHITDADASSPPHLATSPAGAATTRPASGRPAPAPRASAVTATAECAHDGAGLACGHSCDACSLAALRRPAPTAANRRPSPR